MDPVPLHIRQAKRARARAPRAPPVKIQLGNSRDLKSSTSTADAVLLMGPLYHLLDESDRREPLSEAHRVLKPRGVLIGVGVTQFTSMMDGSWEVYLSDPEFKRIVGGDLRSGKHRNPRNVPAYWTTAFFTHPDLLAGEIRAAGFRLKGTFAVEGFVWWVPGLAEKWGDSTFRLRLLKLLRMTEQEPTLMGMGPHIMCVGVKPSR